MIASSALTDRSATSLETTNPGEPGYEALRASLAAKPIRLAAKRAIDLAIASTALLSLAIPMLFIAGLVKLDSSGPVLYRAPRRGRNGRPFTMLKFRSMKIATPADDAAFRARVAESGVLPKSDSDPRLTRLGRLMRKWSIDELPQFINVLRGEMSLIGPRPVLPEMLAVFPDFAKKRELVRPGLGGLWQVRDRGNDGSVSFMRHHDLEYIETLSVRTDLGLLLRTLVATLRLPAGR